MHKGAAGSSIDSNKGLRLLKSSRLDQNPDALFACMHKCGRQSTHDAPAGDYEEVSPAMSERAKAGTSTQFSPAATLRALVFPPGVFTSVT